MANERDFILQLDWRDQKVPALGTGEWVSVYLSQKLDNEDLHLYCALIPNARVTNVLRRYDWDFSIGAGLPWAEFEYGHEEKQVATYRHFTQPDSIQPLVIVRDFHGVKRGYTEVLEEFRLFHNLYFDQATNTYMKFEENGDELIVGKISEKHIQIRLKEIKQFLAIKDMHLALYFDITRWSKLETTEFSDSESYADYQNELIHYEFYLRDADFLLDKKFKIFSRLFGKRLIPGMPKEKTGIYPFEIQKEYEEFIIGIDKDGNELTFSCHPDALKFPPFGGVNEWYRTAVQTAPG